MTYRPDLYDIVTPPSLGGDVEWYRAKAQACGGLVLELGAGTGRVTVPIAQAGVSIHALDGSSEMRAALTAKLDVLAPDVRRRVTVVAADMRTFDLPERFRLVIAPFRAFLHNVTDEDRLRTLARVRVHLAPRGVFAFNVFHPSLEYMSHHAGPLAGTWRWIGNFPLPSGGFVARSEANRYDTVNQIVHSQHRYEEYDADGLLLRTTVQRLALAYLYAGDIRHMLDRAGFVDIRIHGGFAGREFSSDTDEFVVEAVSPGPP